MPVGAAIPYSIVGLGDPSHLILAIQFEQEKRGVSKELARLKIAALNDCDT